MFGSTIGPVCDSEVLVNVCACLCKQIMDTQGSIARSIKRNERKIKEEQRQALTKAFVKDIVMVLSVLQYISFLYDESIITSLVRMFTQFLVNAVSIDRFDGNGNANNSGNIALSQLNGLTNSFVMNSSVSGNNQTNNQNNTRDNNNERRSSGLPELNTLEDFFGDWSTERKKFVISNIFLLLFTFWIVIIVYQIFFCLGNYEENLMHHVVGDLNNLKNWNPNNIFTNGYLMVNIIGEIKFRTKFNKFSTIFIVDLVMISLEVLILVINCIVGLGLVKNITVNSNVDENIDYFDGRQGNLLVLKLDPFDAFSQLS